MCGNVLVIEADKAQSDILCRDLNEAGYTVGVAHDGVHGVHLASEMASDFIILDRDRIDNDGLSVCRELRTANRIVPILLLSHRKETEDRVAALDIGADDYLTKPYDARELIARLRALARRSAFSSEQSITVMDLHIDRVMRRVMRGKSRIALSDREYDLLEALAMKAGQILTPEIIQDQIWGRRNCTHGIIAVHISHLRKKVDDGHKIKLIHTVYGQGYRLIGPSNN